MSIWNKPLNRETFDDFFHLFAPAAYRSSYRILGDSTRTENALTEAFLEIYQKRNSEEQGDIVFAFSDILQKKVETLTAQYPLAETSSPKTRLLDEFTENAILDELHRRIDSAPFRIVEAFTSSASTLVSSHSEPFVLQIRKTGVSVLLILQLILAAIIVALITSAAGKIFGVTNLAPKTPEKQEVGIMDSIVLMLDYLPLRETEPTASTAALPGESTVAGSADTTTTAALPGLSSETVQSSEESATVSATRG